MVLRLSKSLPSSHLALVIQKIFVLSLMTITQHFSRLGAVGLLDLIDTQCSYFHLYANWNKVKNALRNVNNVNKTAQIFSPQLLPHRPYPVLRPQPHRSTPSATPHPLPCLSVLGAAPPPSVMDGSTVDGHNELLVRGLAQTPHQFLPFTGVITNRRGPWPATTLLHGAIVIDSLSLSRGTLFIIQRQDVAVITVENITTDWPPVDSTTDLGVVTGVVLATEKKVYQLPVA